jgi:NAD(P)-dependent dehydrogenase (short-subunit alcohol dehydrogenase family)
MGRVGALYSASKAAVRSFARTWTTDLKQRRIRVKAVRPDATDTPRLKDLLASAESCRERLQSCRGGCSRKCTKTHCRRSRDW